MRRNKRRRVAVEVTGKLLVKTPLDEETENLFPLDLQDDKYSTPLLHFPTDRPRPGNLYHPGRLHLLIKHVRYEFVLIRQK